MLSFDPLHSSSFHFDTLLNSPDRCYFKEGKRVLHFWKPQQIQRTEASIWGMFPISIDTGVYQYIEKAIALGLYLELEVGTWIGDTTKREQGVMNSNPSILPLLGANAKDEQSHYQGFLFASASYPVSESVLREARSLSNSWLDLANRHHPLLLAYAAEMGVFLTSLGALRLFGGSSLCEMAERINVDETRHVRTNALLLKELGQSPTSLPTEVKQTVLDTVSWLFNELEVPGNMIGTPVDFNRELSLTYSQEFMNTGKCPELNDLTQVCGEFLPFENSNSKTYSRSVYE